jgi:hypothetical protein
MPLHAHVVTLTLLGLRICRHVHLVVLNIDIGRPRVEYGCFAHSMTTISQHVVHWDRNGSNIA